MNDRERTQADLIAENEELRRRLAAAEAAAVDTKRAEEELKREHQRAQQYLDVAGVMMVALDRDGNIRLLNRKGHTLLGYDNGELLGKNWFDTCVPQRIRNEVKSVFAELMAGKEGLAEYYDNPVLTRCGEERMIAWHNAALEDDGGTIVGTLSSGLDITERKQAEEALRRAHDDLEGKVRERTAELSAANDQLRLFRMFVEASGQGLGMADLDGYITYWNPTLCRFFGEDRPEDVVGKHVTSYYPPGYFEKLQNEILKAVIRDGHWQGELVVYSRQGKATPILQNTFLIRDEQGKPVRLAAAITDISERKRAEEALRHSEEIYRTLVETSPDGVLMADLEGHITLASRRVLEHYGAERVEDLLGRNPLEFVVEKDHARFLANLQKTVEEGITRDIEYSFLRKDGTHFAGEISAAVIRDPSGRPTGIVAILRDITERHAAHAALQRERRTLEHLLHSSDHERQLIAYDIHDGLAQHLAGAIMQFEVFDHLKEAQPRRAADAYHAGLTMLRQGHYEARRLISGVRPPILDESGVVAAIAHLVHDPSVGRGPKVEFHSKVTFRRLAPVLENAIYRIVQEGLANACTHSKSDRVRISLLQRGERLRIEIRDWGIGFDPKAVQENRFGLEGIRERARLLGGRQRIDTGPGLGVRIVVQLPLVPREAE